MASSGLHRFVPFWHYHRMHSRLLSAELHVGPGQSLVKYLRAQESGLPRSYFGSASALLGFGRSIFRTSSSAGRKMAQANHEMEVSLPNEAPGSLSLWTYRKVAACEDK